MDVHELRSLAASLESALRSAYELVCGVVRSVIWLLEGSTIMVKILWLLLKCICYCSHR